jgi:hypothetical protein
MLAWGKPLLMGKQVNQTALPCNSCFQLKPLDLLLAESAEGQGGEFSLGWGVTLSSVIFNSCPRSIFYTLLIFFYPNQAFY